MERRIIDFRALGAAIVAIALANDAFGQEKTTRAKGEIVSDLDKATLHVFQAKNGDYWFGSQHRGVYRYDGKTLVNFTTRDGLHFNHMGGIQEDKSGNICFLTTSDADHQKYPQAISRFDGKAFSTLHVTEDGGSDNGWRLHPDDLWFSGGQDSGVVLRYDGKAVHRLKFPKIKDGEDHIAAFPRAQFPNMKFNPYDTYRIFKDSKGNLWFGTSNLGVCRYDGKSFAWIPESELQHGSFGARSIIEDKNGKFLFCNSEHRYEVDLSNPAKPSFKRAPGIRATNKEPIDGIMSCVVDRTGALWIATYGTGVWRDDGKNVTHYPVKDGDRGISIFSIYQDNQGVLWLGTQASGVYRFNGKSFEKFRP